MNNWQFFYERLALHSEAVRRVPERIESIGEDEETFPGKLIDSFLPAHPFHVHGQLNPLLTHTESLSEIDKVPFPHTFLDCDLDVSHLHEKQFGCKIHRIRGILIVEHEKPVLKVQGGGFIEGNGTAIRIYALCIDEEEKGKQGYSFNTVNIVKEGIYKDIGYMTNTPRLRKYIINYVCNVLTLINDPEREIELVEHTPSSAKNRRRERQGLHPLPTMTVLLPVGSLRRYIRRLETEYESAYYSHRFWVRGHYRRLYSERYKEKRVTWVKPYIKGEGILIKKKYEVEQ
jgi:hypothetical protein